MISISYYLLLVFIIFCTGPKTDGCTNEWVHYLPANRRCVQLRSVASCLHSMIGQKSDPAVPRPGAWHAADQWPHALICLVISSFVSIYLLKELSSLMRLCACGGWCGVRCQIWFMASRTLPFLKGIMTQEFPLGTKLDYSRTE